MVRVDGTPVAPDAGREQIQREQHQHTGGATGRSLSPCTPRKADAPAKAHNIHAWMRGIQSMVTSRSSVNSSSVLPAPITTAVSGSLARVTGDTLVSGSGSALKTQRSRSEPFLLVDDVEKRLTGGEAPAVFDQNGLPLVTIGGAVDRNMRRDQHIRHCPQRMVRR